MVKIDWKIEKERLKGLPHIASVLSYSPKYYQERIQKIGFVGQKTRLLDAACGAGIWAVAASGLNREVFGIDATEKYLAVAQDIKKALKIENLKLKIGQLENLPYPDEYFDFIICYDAWMYTKREKSIQEMFRVLKPSGRIYLGSIAGLGWYLAMIIQGLQKGERNMVLTAIKAIKNHVYLTKYQAEGLVQRQELEVLGVGTDGSLGNKINNIKPMFQGKYWGFWCVYEILAQKKGKNEN